MSMYGHNFYYESALVLLFKEKKRPELYFDTKNKPISAEIADIEMIQIVAACG